MIDSTLEETREGRGEVTAAGRGYEVEKYAGILGGGILTVFGVTRRSFGGVLLAGLGALIFARGLRKKKKKRARSNGAYGLLARWSSGSAKLAAYESVTVLRTKREIFEQWGRVENLPSLLTHVRSIQSMGKGLYRWVISGPGGLILDRDVNVTVSEEQWRVSWRTVEGSGVTHMGFVGLRPAPKDLGTEVHVSLLYDATDEDFLLPSGWYRREETRERLAEDLRRFKQVLECGEVATTRGQPSGRAHVRRRRKARPLGGRDESLPIVVGPEANR